MHEKRREKSSGASHSCQPETAALTSVHLGKGLQSRQSLFTIGVADGRDPQVSPKAKIRVGRGGGEMAQGRDSALVLAQQGVGVSGGQAGPWG